MSKKFAVFDIDGTIFRWQLYHELFDEFHRRGIISDEDAQPVYDARNIWQNRVSQFEEYEHVLIGIMEATMDGADETAVNDAAQHIIETSGSRIYRYTSSLLADLKVKGYTIVAISGSHHQIVELFASRYEIDIVHGRQFTAVDGRFSADAAPIYGNKATVLKTIVEQHDLDWSDSYAVGDTNSDGDMMELVTHPIAFNPDKKLFERAKANSWPIVVERKNVIYELQPDGNAYLLA